ncbi:MAG: YoaK family protein [Polyangiales bacterium]
MEAHTGSGIVERLSHAGGLHAGALCSGMMTAPLLGVGAQERPSRVTVQAAPAHVPSVQTLSAALACIAGYLDAVSLASDGAFCAHVTGPLVVVASRLLQRLPVDPLSLSALPLFAATVVVVTRLYRRWAPRGELSACRWILMYQSVWVAAAWLVAHLAPAGKLGRLAVACLVIALAAQNALHRLSPSLSTCTTAMTGNLAQWLSELGSSPRGSTSRAARVLSAFAGGAAAGAIATRFLGVDALLLPLCAYTSLVHALPLVVRSDVCYKSSQRAAS